MPTVLLRLLLIVTLVLNGSGAAMASTQMASQFGSADGARVTPAPVRASSQAPAHDARQVTAPAVASTHPALPCHDMPGTERIAAATADALQTAEIAPAESAGGQSPQHPLPSHCDGGPCQCACLHVAQAMTAHPRVPALGAGTSAMPQPGIDAHAEPALPHLIRPPIG